MNYKIVKEKVENSRGESTTYWALMEYQDGVNAPWICVADNKNRVALQRYKDKLDKGYL